MTRTKFLSNLLFFALFVGLLLAAPLVFAEVESGSYIQLETSQLNFYKYNQWNRPAGTLDSKASIEIPRFVIQHDSSTNIDLNATLKRWDEFAQANPSMRPINVGGKTLYPVRVKNDPDGLVSSNSIGFVELEKLLDSENTFSTQKKVVVQPAVTTQQGEEPIYDPNQIAGYGSTEIIQDSETTSSETTSNEPEVPAYSDQAISTSSRPQVRPKNLAPTTKAPTASDIASRASFKCEQSWATRGYVSSNCLSRQDPPMDIVDRAIHTMKDLNAINYLRGNTNPIDARFSICIARKESHISPNARTPDPNSTAKGTFQITDTTGKDAIVFTDPVTPGLEHLDTKSEYQQYANKMKTSTLAQADLHHMTLLLKMSSLRRSGLLVGKLDTDREYWNLAKYYYSKYSGTNYANKIMSCYRKIKQGVNSDGSLRSNGRSIMLEAFRLTNN